MDKPLKNVLRFAGVALGLAATIWAMRDKLLPAPRVPDEPPPRFRTGSDRTTADAGDGDGDDLTVIKGIGPVYAGRLADVGITTFDGLATSDADAVAAAAGVSGPIAAEWIEQAAAPR